MLYQAAIVALIVFVTVGGAESLGLSMLNRPIVIGPLVGLALGDVQSGLLIGAALEAVFMGVVNIGGASSAEPDWQPPSVLRSPSTWAEAPRSPFRWRSRSDCWTPGQDPHLHLHRGLVRSGLRSISRPR